MQRNTKTPTHTKKSSGSTNATKIDSSNVPELMMAVVDSLEKREMTTDTAAVYVRAAEVALEAERIKKGLIPRCK